MGSPVSLASLFEGVLGVEEALLLARDGQLLDSAGQVTSPEEVAAALAVLVRELEKASELLQIGVCNKVMVKATKSARLLVAKTEAIAAVRVDAKRPTADLESKLVSGDWEPSEWNRPQRTAPGVAAPEPLRSSTPVGLHAVAAVPPADVRVSLLEPARAKLVAPGAGPRPASREAVFTGQLQLFSLPDLLEFLRGGQRTGRLVCHAAGGSGIVRMRRGRIIGASSPGVARLGEYLVRHAVLSAEQLRAAVESQRAGGQRSLLGRVLIERQVATPADIRTALVAQVQDAVRELKDWVEGEFAFEPEAAVEPSLAEVDVELDPQAILLTIFKEEDELKQAQ